VPKDAWRRASGEISGKRTQQLEKHNLQIPITGGVRKIGRDEGEVFNYAGAQFRWKAKGEDTGYIFSIYEQVLSPGEGVPLHCHASAEVFYVLSGVVDFLRLDREGNKEWVRCSRGETLLVPTNALHAFYNRTGENSCLLSISTQLHQAFFDAIVQADGVESFSSMPPSQAMMRVGEIAAQYDMHFFPFTPPETDLRPK
jgi:quercetin dioxygenase-like cupin family protein